MHAGADFHQAADLPPDEAAAIFAASGAPPLGTAPQLSNRRLDAEVKLNRRGAVG